ncbi:conserved protein of unknown function [Sterolibacterium denitrificans]|uniref:DUF4336 domain-containing protein n=1 Tax=Sterolibacterium denitrificans TaxID=157592 RepID=A0A7Z7HNR2_9PROT|nr:DUF4336 domain-containing protein [Sterolibacterium denitrificans]SMB21047.1 conserved protein of unknown function [Sterolibacterium denitrificans]
MNPTTMLTPVAQDLWTAHHPMRLLGMPMTAAMTVVRLAHRLWIHSPIPLPAALRGELDALGAAAWAVAPNRHHHLFALDFLAAYPAAQLFIAPRLVTKVAGLAGFPTIPTDASAPWHGAIDGLLIEGNSEMSETVFFHRPSKSLIVSDLGVHFGPWNAGMTQLYARLNGCHGRFGQTLLLKLPYRDKAAARASLQRVLAWDFERIVPAHGPVIENGAHAAFEQAFAWLLRGK